MYNPFSELYYWILEHLNGRLYELRRRRLLERKILLSHLAFAVKLNPELHRTYSGWRMYCIMQVADRKRSGQFYYGEGVEAPTWKGSEELLYHQDVVEDLLDITRT